MSKSEVRALPTGRILREVRDPRTGFTEISLANGVKIVVHGKASGASSASHSRKIDIRGTREGGYTLYPETQRTAARNAASIVYHSGFGQFDKFRLREYLPGKGVAVGAGHVSMDRSSIDGSSNLPGL